MSYSLGIDLGTTFVAAAISRDGQRVEMVPLGDRTVTEPSVVLRRDDGSLAVGDAAARQAGSRPGDVAWGVKRRLGDPTPVALGGEARPAGELLAAMLRDVLARITAEEGEPPSRVVLTHPANWGPYRRGLFEDVAAEAGLEDPPMLTEPEAAGVHFGVTRGLAEGELLGVYDLGGGTFDAAVLRGRAAGVEILGVPEGMEHLGGVDFDEAVLGRVDQACGGAVSELDAHDSRARAAAARVRQDCVVAKETLSVDDRANVPVLLPTRQEEVTVSRDEFEAMIRAPLTSTVDALRRALESAGVGADALTAVLLVGGSSRIPLVARMVGEALGCRTVVDSHPKHAVALGAAVVAARGSAAVGGLAAARPVGADGTTRPTSPPPSPAALPVNLPVTYAPNPTVVHSPDPVAATRALPRDPAAVRAAMQAPAQAPASAPSPPRPGPGRGPGIPAGPGAPPPGRPAGPARPPGGVDSGYHPRPTVGGHAGPDRGGPARPGPRPPMPPPGPPPRTAAPARRAPHSRARRTPAGPHGSPGSRTAAPRHPDDRDAQAGRRRSAGRLEAHPHRRDRRRGPARARRPRRRRGDLPALRRRRERRPVCPPAPRGLSRVARRYLDRDDPDADRPAHPGLSETDGLRALRRGPRRRVLRAGRRPPVPVVRPVRARRDPVVAGAGARRPGPGPGAGRAHRPHRPALRPAGHARDPRDARAGVRRPAHRRGPALPRLPADHDRGGDPRRRRRPVDHPDLPRPQPRRARAGARRARRARRRRGPLRHRRRAGSGRAARDHPGVRPRQHPPRAPRRHRGGPRRRRRRPGRPARRAPRRGARGEAAGRRHPRRRQPRRVAGGPRVLPRRGARRRRRPARDRGRRRLHRRGHRRRAVRLPGPRPRPRGGRRRAQRPRPARGRDRRRGRRGRGDARGARRGRREPLGPRLRRGWRVGTEVKAEIASRLAGRRS